MTAPSVHREGQGKTWPGMGIGTEELGAQNFQLSGPAVTRWYKVEEVEEAPSGVGNPYGGGINLALLY